MVPSYNGRKGNSQEKISSRDISDIINPEKEPRETRGGKGLASAPQTGPGNFRRGKGGEGKWPRASSTGWPVAAMRVGITANLRAASRAPGSGLLRSGVRGRERGGWPGRPADYRGEGNLKAWEEKMIPLGGGPGVSNPGDLAAVRSGGLPFWPKKYGNPAEDASLVIGLGPGFRAGKDVHLVVETNRGHKPG